MRDLRYLVGQYTAEVPNLLSINFDSLRPYTFDGAQLNSDVVLGGEEWWDSLAKLSSVGTSGAIDLAMDVVLWVTPVVEASLFGAEVQLSEVVVAGVVDVGCMREWVLLS